MVFMAWRLWLEGQLSMLCVCVVLVFQWLPLPLPFLGPFICIELQHQARALGLQNIILLPDSSLFPHNNMQKGKKLEIKIWKKKSPSPHYERLLRWKCYGTKGLSQPNDKQKETLEMKIWCDKRSLSPHDEKRREKKRKYMRQKVSLSLHPMMSKRENFQEAN